MQRLADTGRRVGVAGIDGNAVERLVARAYIGEVGIRKIAARDCRTLAARVRFPQCHQLVRSAERQRPQQQRIHHREHGCRRANTQRQGNQGNDGESPGAHQVPDGVAYIAGKGSHATYLAAFEPPQRESA